MTCIIIIPQAARIFKACTSFFMTDSPLEIHISDLSEIRFYICTAVCDMPGAYCKLIARKNYDPVPQYAQIILFRFVPDINGDDAIA